MPFVSSLICRACRGTVEKRAAIRCPTCGGALDPAYDWEALGAAIDRDALQTRPRTMWRYRELLPLDDDPLWSCDVGFTPLIEASALAGALGVGRAWIKVDAFSYPSLSFKDRVVAVAINKARELGIDTVGCPSTGNLANAVAAHAAQAGLVAWIFVPDDLGPVKLSGTSIFQPGVVRVRGTYDQINRLATEAAERFGWGMVNVNLRAYYGEGSKTMAFEIAEQLGWRVPTAIVAPMAGGALVTKLEQGFAELRGLGWVDGSSPRLFGAQAAGCAPIVASVIDGTSEITPVKPHTIVGSIAIGDPVDGRWAARAIRRSGGWAVAVSDPEAIEGVKLLAATTGVFAETAGGVTVGAARLLVREHRLGRRDEVVLAITGNGLKTADAESFAVGTARVIDPDIGQLERLVA